MQDKKAESHVDNISWLSWLAIDMVFLDLCYFAKGIDSTAGDKLWRNGKQSWQGCRTVAISIGRVSSDRVCNAGLTTTTNEGRSWAV
jgi:hypothetical protein